MYRPLQGVRRDNVVRESLAGVTLLAISVPLNIGYAQIAGLPPTAGLYALVVPTIIYALLVSSRQVVVSPDAAAAALVFSSLTGLGVAHDNFAAMAAAQAILSGLMLLAASFFKLGFLANFLSKPILVGFVGGLALEIMVSQVAKMLGVKLEPGGEFFENIADLLTSLGDVSSWSTGLSAVALAILVLGRRLSAAAPWALIVLVLATVVTAVWDLDSRGVAVLGNVQAGPPQFALPQLSFTDWLTLVPSAMALTLVTIAEGLLIARSYAEKNDYRTEPDRDLLAFGAANVAAGLSSSFAAGSSTSRTAAMDQVGSRTQLPSLVLAGGTLLLLLFGTSLLAEIPSPAIGAVVAVAVFRLLGLAELRQLWRLSRFELAIAGACVAGVLLLGPLGGLFLAFVLSLINVVRRAASPSIDLLTGSADPEVSLLGVSEDGQETAPGVVVLRFAAPLFFANGTALSDRIKDVVTATATGRPVRTVVLDLEAMTDVDVTGAEALQGAKEWLSARGTELAYTRMRAGLRARLDHFGLLDGTREYDTNRQAVSALRTEVDGGER